MSRHSMKDVVASPMKLLQSYSSKRQACAVEHKPKIRHNAQSLYHNVRFRMENWRGTDRRDSITHWLWIDRWDFARSYSSGRSLDNV